MSSIQWRDTPPASSRLAHMALKRVPAGRPIAGAITSPTIVGLDTHYVGGRTLPHTESDCPGCQAQRRKAWEGYISIWTTKPSQHIIVALTPPAANDILDAAPDPTNLRGLFVTLDRVRNRANAKLRATISEQQFPDMRLPPIPDLRAHLWHIWGLDESAITEDHPLYQHAVRGLIKSPTDNASLDRQ